MIRDVAAKVTVKMSISGDIYNVYHPSWFRHHFICNGCDSSGFGFGFDFGFRKDCSKVPSSISLFVIWLKTF